MQMFTGLMFLLSGIALSVLFKISIVDIAYRPLPDGGYGELYGPVSFFRLPVYGLCAMVSIVGLVILMAFWNPIRLWLILAFALVAHPLISAASVQGAERPNILLIVVDDLGYGELGCQGNAEIPTPHIDSLAQDGVRFTNAYVTASFCSPSRAGLLTGRYQTRFGHELNPTGRHNLSPSAALPASERTVADELKAAGYATGLVGKWHLGGTDEAHPLRRGFDEFYGFLHEGHLFVPPPYEGVTSFLRRAQLPERATGQRFAEGNTIWTSHLGRNEPPYDENNPILRGTQPIREEAYLTDALAREAVTSIDRHKAEPFFLYLSWNAVHSPLQGADAYMERFAHIEDIHRRVFAAMLANLDDGIGAVLEKLRDEGIDERTLVFFISDNGGPTAELTSSNHPLRGGKGDLYEGGIRVPFLVRWPGVLPAGMTYDQPVISTDIFATACAAAGAGCDEQKLDGVDLRPYLTETASGPPHNALYWRMGNKDALRQGDWKIVRHRRNAEFELYDLARDVSETADLAATHPEKLAALTGRWEKLDAEMVDPVWAPNPR